MWHCAFQTVFSLFFSRSFFCPGGKHHHPKIWNQESFLPMKWSFLSLLFVLRIQQGQRLKVSLPFPTKFSNEKKKGYEKNRKAGDFWGTLWLKQMAKGYADRNLAVAPYLVPLRSWTESLNLSGWFSSFGFRNETQKVYFTGWWSNDLRYVTKIPLTKTPRFNQLWNYSSCACFCHKMGPY